MTVVGDLDELEAPVLDDDVDGGGSGVEAVLEELFHGGARALDHLSGGDPVHDGGIEPTDLRRVSVESLGF